MKEKGRDGGGEKINEYERSSSPLFEVNLISLPFSLFLFFSRGL